MEIKKLIRRKGTKLCYKVKKISTLYERNRLTYSEIRYYVQQLQFYSSIFLDPAIRVTNMQAKKAIKILNKILAHSSRTDLQKIPEVKSVVMCSLVLVQGYVAHLKVNTSWFVRYKQRRLYSAEACFTTLIKMLIPELLSMVVETVFEFLKNEQLWKVEFICCEILLALLSCQAPASDLMAKMLDYLDETLLSNDLKMARHIITILHDIMITEFWKHQKIKDLDRLIHIYHASVKNSSYDNQVHQLTRGYEVCLKRVCEIIDPQDLNDVLSLMIQLAFETDLQDEAILDFGNTIEYVALCLKSDIIAVVLKEDTFIYLLNVIASQNPNRSLTSCRLLSRLFDRHNNYLNFLTPFCFLVDTDYPLVVAKLATSDRSFLKINRNSLHAAIIQAVRQHSVNKVNIQAIYTLLCLIAVGIPCGHASATLVCIAINIQKMALTATNMSVIQTNHLHATCAGILTLICWIHRATSLSLYVQSVINRRYDEAPHLNPPLETQYHYAQHHVLWNKIELFFDAWELRYGLWKFFRCKEHSITNYGINPLQSIRINKKKVKSNN